VDEAATAVTDNRVAMAGKARRRNVMVVLS
jgi:hypothetical protein